jgi:CBS domain-containing protein
MFSRIKELARASEGHAALEYSILLSVVVAAVVALGTGVAATIPRTTAALTGEPAIVNSAPSPQAASQPSNPPWMRILLLAGAATQAVLVVTVVTYVRRTRRLRKRRTRAQRSPDVAPPDFRERRSRLQRIFAKNKAQLSTWELLVEHVMLSPAPAVRASARRSQVEQQLASCEQKVLVVTDKNGQLVGLISEEDLEASAGRVASDIMSTNPPSIEPKIQFSSAVSMMQDRRLACLPVVENQRVRGILTSDELVIALQCAMQLLQEINSEHRKVLLGMLSTAKTPAPTGQ